MRVLTLAEVDQDRPAARGDYTVDAEDHAALRERELHRLRRLRASAVSAEIPTTRTTTASTRSRPPTCRTPWPTRSATCSIPSIVGTPDADKAKAACKYDAIDLGMKEETVEPQGRRGGLGDRLAALRRRQDPALRLRPLRQRHHQRRVRAPGRPARPDRRQDPAPVRRQGGEERRLHPVRRLARREPPAPLLAHLLHGLAQADQLRARGLSATTGKSTIYYIDIRAIDRFEDFYQKVQADPTVKFIKSKVAKHRRGRGHRQPGAARRRHRGLSPLRHRARPGGAGGRHGARASRAPSMPGGRDRATPAASSKARPADGGMFGAGCASNALDVNRAVQSATAAALRAIQVVNRVARAEA
ncbi:MAG: hypothetical protein MZV65_48560 [Chromatiales bacterium]|nr:hypothetical protein [Chromatiales bacterium]